MSAFDKPQLTIKVFAARPALNAWHAGDSISMNLNDFEGKLRPE